MVRALTSSPGHHFFGFHDVCPWDEADRFVLAHETDFIDRPPMAEDAARICVIDTKNNNAIRVVAETHAWNFHQGARLQWISRGKNKIIYNDRRMDEHGGLQFVSVLLDIESKQEEVFEYPVYSVSPDGRFGLGVDFSRLQKYGGYGYAANREQRTENKEHFDNSYPQDDGIWRVDFETGEARLLVSTYDIAHINHSTKENENHVITHVTFNPSGTRICVMDKYRLPDGGFMQRLVTANPDGSDLYVLPGHITHYCWKNDAEILGFGKLSPRIAALRNKGVFQNPLLKPLLAIARKMRGALKQKIAGQSYFLLTDKSQKIERIAVGVMTEDGHPQFSPNRKYVITDTYADKNHERMLILYDWERKKRIDLGNFYSLPAVASAKEGLPSVAPASPAKRDESAKEGLPGVAPDSPAKRDESAKEGLPAVASAKEGLPGVVSEKSSLIDELGMVVLPNGKKEHWDISQMRADLHPRWNRDGTKVCFDSVHEGTRQMYAIDLVSN